MDNFSKGGFNDGNFNKSDFTEAGGFTEGDQTEAAPWERCQDDDQDLGKGDVNEDGFSNGDFNERARLRPSGTLHMNKDHMENDDPKKQLASRTVQS